MREIQHAWACSLVTAPFVVCVIWPAKYGFEVAYRMASLNTVLGFSPNQFAPRFPRHFLSYRNQRFASDAFDLLSKISVG